MKHEVTRKEDGTIVIKITIPWKDAEKTREEVVDELVKQVESPGFRRGKVPKKIAEQKVSKQAVREEMLKKILSKSYVEVIEKEGIHPILNPRIHVDAFEEGTDIVFTAETCEEPPVVLKNYKEEVKKITAKSKIVIPGKEEQKVNMDEVLEAALKSSEINLPKILVEQEVNRLLSQLLDELKTLGLTLEQYLSSRGKTAESLREEYQQKAEKDLKLEFLLRKVADEEKITVEQKDIEGVLATIKDEKQKADLAKNPYVMASIIRQQKTLDFLSKI